MKKSKKNRFDQFQCVKIEKTVLKKLKGGTTEGVIIEDVVDM